MFQLGMDTGLVLFQFADQSLASKILAQCLAFVRSHCGLSYDILALDFLALGFALASSLQNTVAYSPKKTSELRYIVYFGDCTGTRKIGLIVHSRMAAVE